MRRGLLPMIALALVSCKHSPATKRSDADAAKLVPWLYGAEEYGYVTRDGKKVFAERYTDARRFHEGRAAVATSRGHAGFIDADGKVVVPLKYDFVDDFRDGKARVFHFREPILGPVQNVILRDGELTEAIVDRDGHESGVTKTAANTIPPIFPDWRPVSAPMRWEIFIGEGGKQGLREIATKREVFPAQYGEFKYIQDMAGAGFTYLATRDPNDAPPPGPRWTVYDLAAKPIIKGASEVGEYSSEDCFTIGDYVEPSGAIWSAVDRTGRRVVSIPYADAFVFVDGIAAVTVSDLVMPIFVSHDGRLYADMPAIDSRHHAVGREPIVLDGGAH